MGRKGTNLPTSRLQIDGSFSERLSITLSRMQAECWSLGPFPAHSVRVTTRFASYASLRTRQKEGVDAIDAIKHMRSVVVGPPNSKDGARPMLHYTCCRHQNGVLQLL
jgi:hypothetical protein